MAGSLCQPDHHSPRALGAPPGTTLVWLTPCCHCPPMARLLPEMEASGKTNTPLLPSAVGCSPVTPVTTETRVVHTGLRGPGPAPPTRSWLFLPLCPTSMQTKADFTNWTHKTSGTMHLGALGDGFDPDLPLKKCCLLASPLGRAGWWKPRVANTHPKHTLAIVVDWGPQSRPRDHCLSLHRGPEPMRGAEAVSSHDALLRPSSEERNCGVRGGSLL